MTAGNGLVTTRSFNVTNGRLTAITTGAGNAVQNFGYTYDLLGNPLSRSDANTSMSETFAYDSLNRLTSAVVALSPTPLSKSFTYSPIGNILSKSDVGNYNYAARNSPLPHAVMSTSGGTISTTFTYDPNGNQTSGLGRTHHLDVLQQAREHHAGHADHQLPRRYRASTLQAGHAGRDHPLHRGLRRAGRDRQSRHLVCDLDRVSLGR